MKQHLIFYACLVAIVSGSVMWTKYMPGSSYEGSPPVLTSQQKQLSHLYHEQVQQFASKPRSYVHHNSLEETKDYIVDFLGKISPSTNQFQVNILPYGFDRYKNIELVIEPYSTAKNTVVIGAHYDSFLHAPGANDNFSSVVILLELAKRFSQKFNASDTRLRIVFFTNEEPPFFKSNDMGSMRYARYLHDKKENVVAMYAFDMLGFFSEKEDSQHYPILFAPFFPDKGNFVAFVGNLSSRSLVQHSIEAFRQEATIPSQGVSAPSHMVGIDFSDHYSFYRYGWDAIMVTDTAFFRYPHYHLHSDTPDKLNYEKMSLLTDALEAMFRKMYEK